ncbi:MAG: hypothetical protein KA480_06525 [Anaerolineales bacterium]|nr:hypothetical protein [Anaerolineales bacterium]
MAKKDKKTKLQLVVNKDTKPKQNNVKKVVNQAKFKDLSMEEQDKILDRIIDGVNEEAGTTTEDEDPTLLEKEKLVRVQFQKDVTAQEILAGIKEAQDKWAKKFPERAHKLYPKVFDEQGNRIK